MTVLQEYRDDVNRLFEEMRQGTDPSPSDVLAMYPTNKVTIFRSMAPKRLVAGLLATGLYSGWCVLMVTLMSSLLEWAGTADADANPELAKRAFWTTSLSLFALLVEVYLLGAIEGFQKVWTLQKRPGTQEPLRSGRAWLPYTAPQASRPRIHPRARAPLSSRRVDAAQSG
ncbi:hypothetical protein [Streptomyces sp. NPDC054874]